MSFILDFIDFLISTIQTIWDFFIQTINDLISFVQILLSSVGIFVSSVDTLPYWLRPFGLATIGVCVCYLLVGRDSGKSN